MRTKLLRILPVNRFLGKQVMTCRLCKLDLPLRNSHVLPEFIYDTLYDNKHRFHLLTTDPNKRDTWQQKGLRNQLLCDDCETKISVWEGYVKSVFSGEVKLTYEESLGCFWAQRVDYQKLKLFQLANLWRAHESSSEFFESVDLGPFHSEAIRSMLLSSDPGPYFRYPCIMYSIIQKDEPLTATITQPRAIRIKGLRGYRFLFGGFLWAYVVDSQRLQPEYDELLFREGGALKFVTKPAESLPDLNRFRKRYAKANKRSRV